MRVKFKPWNWGFEEVSGTSLRGFVKKCTSDCGRAGCRITRLNIFFSCCFIPDFVLQIFYLSNDDYFYDYFIFIKKLTKITVWQKQSRDVPSNIIFSPTFLLDEAFHPKYGVVCFSIGFVGNMCCKTGKTSETENRIAPKQNVGKGKRLGSLSVSHDLGDDKREQSLVPAFVHLSILVLHLNKDSIKIASTILCRELKVFLDTPHVEWVILANCQSIICCSFRNISVGRRIFKVKCIKNFRKSSSCIFWGTCCHCQWQLNCWRME